jgi:hypothetical protein
MVLKVSELLSSSQEEAHGKAWFLPCPLKHNGRKRGIQPEDASRD